MKKLLKRVALILALPLMGLLAACGNDASVVSANLSKAADNFEIARRIVFVNGITDTYLLEITGLCAIEDQVVQLEVTCKENDGGYKKHFLGLSDNVFYVAEQLDAADANASSYRVTFKPQSILPAINVRASGEDLLDAAPFLN